MPKEEKFCVNCGAKIPTDAEICPVCGTRQPLQKRGLSKTKKVIIGCILIFLLLWFLGSLPPNTNNNKGTSLSTTTKEKQAINSQKKQFRSPQDFHCLQDSIDFLLTKFPDIILNIKDSGGIVYIKIEDSFWYALTPGQKQLFTDRLLDVIYASGDVERILILEDEHSRILFIARL